jgi:hypothetical protein
MLRNAPLTLVILSSAASRTRKDYTSSAHPGKVPSVAKVTGPGSYHLQTLEGEDANNSWNIDQLCRFYAQSTRLHRGLQSIRLLKDPFAVSGLQGQALVSGLLHSRIQPMWLLTDLGLRRATKDSSSGLLRDHILLDSAYTATNGSTAVSGYTP